MMSAKNTSTPSRSAALSKLNSLKISTINAINELNMRAKAAAQAGDTAKESKLKTAAIDLSIKSVAIREAEDAIRASAPLTSTIDQLSDIAEDGRRTARRLKDAADALSDAATLLTILTRLTTLF